MNTASLLTTEQYTALYAHIEHLVNRSGCKHTLRRTRASLVSLREAEGDDRIDVRANITKLIDLGGHCDCEVLMNVTPTDWQERRDDPLFMDDIVGPSQRDSVVSHAMFRAVQMTLWE